ncbi:MAG: serine/threonine-protein kinase [Myxococcota bacterium]|nr:serine/threonine-protein kinase [Myxococcota bacterium]
MVKSGLQIGDYKIEEKLGEGGFATVWKARHPVYGSVALKVLHENLLLEANRVSGPSVIDRFLAEVELLKSLKHPGFVQIHEPLVHLEDSFLGYSMELLHGNNLSAWIAKIPLTPLILVMAAIADTLETLHQREIIHRDVKASNIFLNQSQDGDADYYSVKLIDFGIAKQLSETRVLESTAAGYLVGTIGRLPPECFQRWEDNSVMVGTKVDQWCFGVTLYYVLSGRMPFHAQNTTELINSIVSGDFRPFRLQPRFPSNTHSSLFEIIRGCLQVKAEDRFASMLEVGRRLRNVAEIHLEESYENDAAATTSVSSIDHLTHIRTAPVHTLADETLTRWLRDSEFVLIDDSENSETINDYSHDDSNLRLGKTGARSELESGSLKVRQKRRVLVTEFGEAISTDENSQRMRHIEREALQRTIVRGQAKTPSSSASQAETKQALSFGTSNTAVHQSKRPLTEDTLRSDDTTVSPVNDDKSPEGSEDVLSPVSKDDNFINAKSPLAAPKHDGVVTLSIGLLCVVVGFLSYFIVWWLRRN